MSNFASASFYDGAVSLSYGMIRILSGPQTDHSHADLDDAPIIHAVDHRNHSFFGEVHVLDLLIRPINDLTAFRYHVLELREKALVLRALRRGEKGCKDAFLTECWREEPVAVHGLSCAL